jgi:hypothetical protein
LERAPPNLLPPFVPLSILISVVNQRERRRKRKRVKGRRREREKRRRRGGIREGNKDILQQHLLFCNRKITIQVHLFGKLIEGKGKKRKEGERKEKLLTSVKDLIVGYWLTMHLATLYDTPLICSS